MQKGLPELPITKNTNKNWPINWGKKTLVMGVLNITPDSFSDGGLYLEKTKAFNHVDKLVSQGVDVLDVGAQSTRPNAIEVGSNIEIERFKPVLKYIKKKYPNLIISVDTFNSKVAEYALINGANWVNDISGGRHDKNMYQIISLFKCPYVITHSRGNSFTMDDLTKYDNLINDIISELTLLSEEAIKSGIEKSLIIWDPGLGFAKTTHQNIEILRNLYFFKQSGYPILVGPSRKRFIGELTLEKNPQSRIWGTAAVVCKCVEEAVEIVRVHDVEPIKKTILMASYLW